MAALAAGGLIDRYGGRRVYLLACALLFSGSALLARGFVTPSSPLWELLLVRLLQGAGIAGGLPAVLSLVPGLVSRRRLHRDRAMRVGQAVAGLPSES